MSTERNVQTTTDGSTIEVLDTRPEGLHAIASVDAAVRRLTRPDATDEDFITVQHTLAGLKQIVAEYAEQAKEASIDYLDRVGHDVETETERYYVAPVLSTKCRDTRKAVEAVLTAAGGDLDRLCEALASQPLKQGACKTILGDDWDEHFEVTETPDIKTGKPKRAVQRVDPRFQKGND